MAHFEEILRCAGVDEAVDPQTMVVPFPGGTNVVALDGDPFRQLHVVPEPHAPIDVTELDRSSTTIETLRRKRREIYDQLARPDADPQEAYAKRPDMTFFGEKRYFEIRGLSLVGMPGARVKVLRDRPGGRKEEWALLQVVVVDRKTVKLAIRHVQVRDAAGNFVLHSKKPCDPDVECAYMNGVWTPQTNIAFDLVSSSPAQIDDRQPSVKEQLAQAAQIQDPAKAQFPDVVNPKKLRDLFIGLKDGKADLTLFMVKAVGDLKNTVDGRTIPEDGFSLISDSRGHTTMAHEAGHFLAGPDGFDGKAHTSETGSPEMLMRNGGAGWKIPLQITMKNLRSFFDRKKGG